MTRTMWVDPDLYDFDETAECGYLVRIGETFCRSCGGGGLLDGEECADCNAQGSHKRGVSNNV